jgi:hypothetical protein
MTTGHLLTQRTVLPVPLPAICEQKGNILMDYSIPGSTSCVAPARPPTHSFLCPRSRPTSLLSVTHHNPMYLYLSCMALYLISVKLLPLPQPPVHPHGRTYKSKRPESHPTKECARACVRCLNTEPNYYYCPITLVMS